VTVTTRQAGDTDELAVLWPEYPAEAFNREQVFLAVDETNTILAGLLMFHGGHRIAYVGSVVFVATVQQGRIAHALLDAVKAWCRAHGIVRFGHGATTPSCCETLTRLGAVLTGYHLMMELTLDQTEGHHG
jgi:non-ribosomal peptide synthetase component F